ncbi:MAG: tRNA (N(6)-L-threonylcarbamoyladenosine(37)-C(2))-methylthiotransferase MtaB [Proteobacteria bacterium]|nr:tRNA (N(6)-L-threonylcarbamoyladenosine(37)-C(2))-methylthiotransferase MtaB [Pseudomonadota bacterium]
MTKFMMTTLGCKVNQFETEAIGLALIRAGWERTGKGKEAHVCIINTCTVTGKASMQSRQAIRNIIRNCPDARIIVTGCYAQTEASEISKIQGVHRIISHKEKHLIPDMILHDVHDSTSKGLTLSPDCDESCQETEFKSIDVTVFGNRTRPFLKIQDGCNAFCTYCIVPHTRGRSRSMDKDQIITRLHDLGRAGYKEVVLTGIHIGHWGSDLIPRQSFVDLLKHIDDEHPVPRIRLSSIEPREITEDMVSLFAASDMFCHHFHIPLQSGDNGILERMHRPYDRDLFRDRVTTIVSHIPDAAIGVDTLVGFPGETDQAFNNTYELIESLPIMYLHVFPFSPRIKTPAASFPDHVAPDIMKLRTERLRALGALKKETFLKTCCGKTLEVLIENKRDSKSGMLKGLTSNYATVFVDGPDTLFNSLQRVLIDRAYSNHVTGTLIKP